MVPVVLSLAAYYALWARYLTTGREAAALYRPWRGVPLPMALLPVSALLASAAWLDDGWIALAALGIALAVARRASLRWGARPDELPGGGPRPDVPAALGAPGR